MSISEDKAGKVSNVGIEQITLSSKQGFVLDHLRALHILCSSISFKPMAMMSIGLPDESAAALNGVGRFLKDKTDVLIFANDGSSRSLVRVNLGRNAQVTMADGVPDGVQGRFAKSDGVHKINQFHPGRSKSLIEEKKNLDSFANHHDFTNIEAVVIVEARAPIALIENILAQALKTQALIVNFGTNSDQLELITKSIPKKWSCAIIIDHSNGIPIYTLLATLKKINNKKIIDLMDRSRIAKVKPEAQRTKSTVQNQQQPDPAQETLDVLIQQLPTRSPIYLPTNKISLADQIDGLKRVQDVYEQGLDAIYRPRLRALRAHLKGKKRCFIIGNGPSLNKTDLSKLDGEICFAVNGFFLKMPELNWFPTFYLVEDHLVAEDRADQINVMQGPIKLFPAYLAYCLDASENTIFFNHRPRKSYPHGFDFSENASKITYTGCTVTFTAMQLAAYFGFEEIHLIGVDASYDIPDDAKSADTYGTGVLDMKSDDPNHFHPDYFGKGFRWHDPQVGKMVAAYEEAKKVTRMRKIKILNATIGGKLEVFERVDYNGLFGQAEMAADKHQDPKILLIDMTRRGGGTATGELKSLYFDAWPDSKFMHVYSAGHQGLRIDMQGDDNFGIFDAEKPDIYNLCKQFNPDVVIYRPVAEKPDLHGFAMRIIPLLDKPHMIWMMDDWPKRLRNTEPDKAHKLEEDLRVLCANAAVCWSISRAMSGAFGARYGGVFKVLRNSIRAADWKSKQPTSNKNNQVRLRYAGGLAPDMTLQSVVDTAQAVALASEQGIDIQFEILTQQHWLDKYAKLFLNFPQVKISPATLPKKEYQRWVAGADILLMPYNFDADSINYVRYSFANKTPECLASGNAILAYGPKGTETMDFLERHDAAKRVEHASVPNLTNALVDLANNVDLRREWGRKSQSIALKFFDLDRHIAGFRADIKQASQEKAGGLPIVPMQKTKKKPSRFMMYFSGSSHLAKVFRFLLNWKSVVATAAASGLAYAIWMVAGADLQIKTLLITGGVFVSLMIIWGLIAHITVHQNTALEQIEQEIERLRRAVSKRG